jgi:hypothetical protein
MRKVRHRTLLGHFRIIEIGHLGEMLVVSRTPASPLTRTAICEPPGKQPTFVGLVHFVFSVNNGLECVGAAMESLVVSRARQSARPPTLELDEIQCDVLLGAPEIL